MTQFKLLDSPEDPLTKHETEEDDKDDDEEESKQPPEPIYTSDQKSNQLMHKSNESIVSV